MSIRKAVFSLSLALPLALAGCPSTEEEGSIVNCTLDSECLADSEICHPVGLICVPTCETSDDCPANQNVCEKIKDANGNALKEALVCQCKTGDNTFCTNEDDTAAELVCSPIDNVCETKCVANEDCADFSPARECSGGVCVVPGVSCSSDAFCTDPAASNCGTDGKCAACVDDSDCGHIAGGKTDCDAGVCKVPACDPANAVPGSAGGPSICAYGETCNAGACVAIPEATCDGAKKVTWDQAAQGPVLTSISTVFSSTSLEGECANKGAKLEATVTFYAPKGLTYTGDASTLSNSLLMNWSTGAPRQIAFVKADGSMVGAGFVRGVPASGAKNGTFVIGSCGVGQNDAVGRAVYIKDSAGNAGNAICL